MFSGSADGRLSAQSSPRALIAYVDQYIYVCVCDPNTPPGALTSHPRPSNSNPRTSRMGTQKGSILLTGANGDIGSAIASEILSTPDLASYYGLYAVRNIKTATQLSKVLQRSPPDHRHDVVPLELSSLASVRALAADINHRVASGSLPRIRVIIVNAGYFEWTEQHFTDDGMDMSFQANYLGHWLLILLLLKSMDEKEGRVVVVSSSMHE